MTIVLQQLAWLLLELALLWFIYPYHSKWDYAARGFLAFAVIIQVITIGSSAYNRRSERIKLARLGADDDRAFQDALLDPRDGTEYQDLP